MKARLALAAAVLAGLASLAGAAERAAVQAASALQTSRVYDGTPERAGAAPVLAQPGAGRSPEDVAREEQDRARRRSGLSAATGRPIADPVKPTPPLTSWNPLLHGAKGGLAMGIVGFALGGPLGLLVGAAVGGMAAWGLAKIGDA